MHTLKIYKHIIEVAKLVETLAKQIAARDADLARQIRRAMASVGLNCAEGANRKDGNARQRFLSSMGSANETYAGLQMAEALGYIEGTERARDGLDRIARTMNVLAR